MGNQITVSGGALYVTNALVKGSLDVRGGTLTINSGTVTVDSLAVTNFNGAVSFNGGVLNTKGTTVNNGVAFTVGDGTHAATLNLAGGGSGFHFFANGLIIANNATLKGNGTITSAVTVNAGGTLSPGDAPGSITFSNNLTLASGSTFAVTLNGTGAGQYDQIAAFGTVSVSNSVLSLTLGYTPQSGDTFTIVSNQGPNAVFGVFVDPQNGVLTNNATFLAGGTTFQINYDGNANGQDVILTAENVSPVPEPSALLLVALGMVGLLGRKRRRNG
jgi:hypothetical protein